MIKKWKGMWVTGTWRDFMKFLGRSQEVVPRSGGDHSAKEGGMMPSESQFGFDGALKAMKQKLKVARRGWAEGTYVAIKTPGQRAKLTVPYLYRATKDENFVPWVPGHRDLLADDWNIVGNS